MDLVLVGLWAIVVLTIMSIIGTALLVGQPREPVTANEAAFRIALNLVFLAVFIATIVRLH